MLKLDSAAVFLLTLAFSRQDDRPMGVLILAGTTDFITFKVFPFSFCFKSVYFLTDNYAGIFCMYI